MQGIVTTVNGKELANFADSPEMFLANFRFFLDLRNRVNSKISNTVQEKNERKLFWSYNNGVTIVCDKFEVPTSAEENVVNIYRPQIVNGCQTVSILNRPEVHRYSHDIDVLVRIIATKDHELKEKIATFTNTQTKVSDRTLRSNDQIQKSLQHQFGHLDPPYYYDCKDGEWNALPREQKERFFVSGRTYRRITNSDCAKAYIAFHGSPTDAKSAPRLFWDLGTKGLYTMIFPIYRIAEELQLPYLLMDRFSETMEKIIHKIPDNPSEEIKHRSDYLSHCDTTLLALAGYVIQRYLCDDFSKEHLEILIASIDNYAKGLFERCEAAIKYEFVRSYKEDLEKGEIFNSRNYFLRIETIKILKRLIDDHIDLIGEKEYYEKCGFISS